MYRTYKTGIWSSEVTDAAAAAAGADAGATERWFLDRILFVLKETFFPFIL